jgi:hypothetical protein
MTNRGIPIGNLTSQLFANVYLDSLDQFVKHDLHEHYYLRYMDDFLVLHHDKSHLKRSLVDIRQFCAHQLRLELHANKTGIHRFDGRERFVGYDLYPYLRHLSKPTVQRFAKRYVRTRRRSGVDAAADSLAQFKAYAAFAHAEGLVKLWENTLCLGQSRINTDSSAVVTGTTAAMLERSR